MESSDMLSIAPSISLVPICSERLNVEKSPKPYNQTVDSSPSRHGGENSVHEKVVAFNSLAFQAKQLEKKTNDAALRRAVLGREEADSDMRRYRDEARALRKSVEEAKRREKIVGERLETVMVSWCKGKYSIDKSDNPDRKTLAVLRKLSNIQNRFGKKKFGVQRKKTSRPNQLISSYKRS